MSVIKFRSFPETKEKQKLRSLKICVKTPIYTFLRKLEEISDILLISLKSAWNDLEGILSAPDENFKGH